MDRERSTPFVDLFDRPPPGDRDERRRLLGGKGATLAEMSAAGLPVPSGFTLTTAACHHHGAHGWDRTLDTAVAEGIDMLEAATGKRLGDDRAPLLVSVRSGAAVSMPGMMDTVLDVGTTPATAAALASMTGDHGFAADTHRRALRSYAEVVLRAPVELLAGAADEEPSALRARMASAGFVVPDDPRSQVAAAVQAVFESWGSDRARRYREVEGIDHDLGTAATVQAMVFGNLGDRSGTGVAFTRDPSTGVPGLMGDFLPAAQGEDVVAGGHATLPLSEMARVWPDQYAELERIAGLLEHSMADMVDLEFTVEDGTLWLLQARRGKRSPIATLRCAVDMAEDDDFPLDRHAAVERCRTLLQTPPTVAEPDPAGDVGTVLASGLPASPGVATGALCLDPDEAVERQAAGEAVVLVRRETSPADVHGMAASVGLFTLSGGLVSHAAVVARDWGLPGVVGATGATIVEGGLEGPGGFAGEGTIVTVDGTAGTLSIGTGAARRREAPEVATIRSWAEALDVPSPEPRSAADFEVVHSLRIRGMADAPAIAERTGFGIGRVRAELATLELAGHAIHVEARDSWRLSPEGREAHAALLAARIADIDLAALPYDRFLVLNTSFKQLCTDWQVRDGEPNDHLDAAHDARIVDRLVALDAETATVLDGIVPVLPWTSGYRDRLSGALTRMRSGDPKALTGVLCGSYHDVWMELHEDLILTQGLDRAAEGST